MLSWPFLLTGSFILLFATLASQENVILWINIRGMNTLNIQSPCYTALSKLLKCWVTFPWIYPWDQLHWEGSKGQILHLAVPISTSHLMFAPSNVLTCLSVDVTNSDFYPDDGSFFPHIGSFSRTSVVRKEAAQKHSSDNSNKSSKQFSRSDWNSSFVVLLLQAKTSKENKDMINY